MSASWSEAKCLDRGQLAPLALFAMGEGLSASLPITCLAFLPYAHTKCHILNQCFPGSLSETQKPVQVFILPLNKVNLFESYTWGLKEMCKQSGKGLRSSPQGCRVGTSQCFSPKCQLPLYLSRLFSSPSSLSKMDGTTARHSAVCPAETQQEDPTGLPLNCHIHYNHISISGFLNSACSGEASFGHRE